MKYYLGIDGGGTKTTYTVIDEKENVLSTIRGEGTAIDTYPLKEVEKRLLKCIESLPYKFSGIFAGLGGIACEKDIKDINKILKKAKNCKGLVGSDNDVSNALRGTIPDGNGIVVIIGTGSVAYGVNGNKKHRAGGYGYKEGDAGSAYWLGQKALIYLARVIDKRLPESSFSKALEDTLNAHTFAELAKVISNLERVDIAKLAMVVTSYANNKSAKYILQWGVTELITQIHTVYRECGFKKCKFAIVGSLGSAETYYKHELLRRLNKNIIYVHDMHDAGLGSALLAKALKK